MTATRVKKIRRRLRWTQKKLADQLGVNVRTIQNWEVKGCPQFAWAVLSTLE